MINVIMKIRFVERVCKMGGVEQELFLLGNIYFKLYELIIEVMEVFLRVGGIWGIKFYFNINFFMWC